MTHIKTTAVFALLWLVSTGAWAGSTSSWSERADERASRRWTLQEWMAQKQRMALMDQWLSMNSSSPFEFYIKGVNLSYSSKKDSDPQKSYDAGGASFAAFAQTVGLTGEYENNWDENFSDVSGMLSVRVLGNSTQSTSLTLHMGQRTRDLWHQNEKETLKNLLGQISLQAYLTRYFGIQGHYRHYLPTKNRNIGDVEGTLTESGIFIDFQGLRVFGSWYQDVQLETLNAVESKTKRTGYKTGLQIFF